MKVLENDRIVFVI